MSVTDWMEWAWSGNWNQSGYEVPTCPWQLPVWQPPLPSACYAGDVVGAPPVRRARLRYRGRDYGLVAASALPPPTLGEGWVIRDGEWMLQSFGPGRRGPATVPLGAAHRAVGGPQCGDIAITPKHGPTRCYDTDAGYVRHVPCASGAVPTVGGGDPQQGDCVTYSFAAHEVTRAQHVLRLRRTPHAWRPYPHGGGATAFVPVGWLMFMKGEAERLPAAFRAAGLNPGMVLSTSPCPDDAPRFQDTVGGDCCIPAYDWGISTDFPVNLPPNRNVTYVRPRYLPAFADPTAVAQYTCAGPVSGEAWFVPGGTAPDTRELPPRYLAGAATLATRILRGQVVTAGNRGILQRRFPGVRFDVVTGYSCHTEEYRLNTVRICVDRGGRFLSAQVG